MQDMLSLFQDELCTWFMEHNWRWAYAHCEQVVNLIATLILSVLGFLSWLTTRLFNLWLKRRAASSLLPYLKRAEVRKYTRFFIPTRVQSDNPADQHDFKKLKPSEPYLDFFIKKVFQDADDAERFHLVLGGAGMGKTTFLVNLAIRYRLRLMLRFWETTYQIFYLPLFAPDVLEKIAAIENQPYSILLLDALDEDPLANNSATQRIQALIQAAKDFHTVIITCRTQFFDTVDEEEIKTRIYRHNRYLSFDKTYVAPFSPKEIRTYLLKKYRFQATKRQRAWELVMDFRDLMARPLILSYIDDLLEGKQHYHFRFQVYEKIIAEWIHRESHRPHVPEGEHETYRTNLRAFSQQIAQTIYQRFQEQEGQHVPEQLFTQLAEAKKLTLRPKDMKTRSLLTRNSAGQWKFAHRSIMEYFLAELAINKQLEPYFPEELDMARNFYEEMKFVPSMRRIAGGTHQIDQSHNLHIDSFEIGLYPVTQQQWEFIMGYNPSEFKGENRPVENVSWKDCQKFIKALNKRTGLDYRLPTEAEWAYAASSGAIHPDPTAKLEAYAWYDQNSEGETQPVGQKQPNLLGLYDMSGNVWEWCQDWFEEDFDPAAGNPAGPVMGTHRVVRGGSWHDGAKYCGNSVRMCHLPGHRYGGLGFRLAR